VRAAQRFKEGRFKGNDGDFNHGCEATTALSNRCSLPTFPGRSFLKDMEWGLVATF